MSTPPPPRYTARRIADELRAAITSGEYRPGHQLPSGRALMARYNVAQQTVQNAFDLLRAEGLVIGRPGAGVFVKTPPTVRRLTRNRLSAAARRRGRGWFLADADASGFTPDVQVRIYREPADQRVADALDIELGAEVVVRHRIMSADGKPVQQAVSRFPASLAGGTRLEEVYTGRTGAWGVLEELGRAVADGVEYVATRMPSAAERADLQLEDGVPVLAVTRVVHDAEGVPLEVNDMVLAGDRYELSYDLQID